MADRVDQAADQIPGQKSIRIPVGIEFRDHEANARGAAHEDPERIERRIHAEGMRMGDIGGGEVHDVHVEVNEKSSGPAFHVNQRLTRPAPGVLTQVAHRIPEHG